ncbi:hypothetical protein HPC49_10320 [Pyxidicoccus fallax]|nr:hypothetical protein [Pyxidicoccus fallax]
MSSIKRTDTEASRQFWESLERNRRVIATWPDWMRRGSVGESLVREWDEPEETVSKQPEEESHSG